MSAAVQHVNIIILTRIWTLQTLFIDIVSVIVIFCTEIDFPQGSWILKGIFWHVTCTKTQESQKAKPDSQTKETTRLSFICMSINEVNVTTVITLINLLKSIIIIIKTCLLTLLFATIFLTLHHDHHRRDFVFIIIYIYLWKLIPTNQSSSAWVFYIAAEIAWKRFLSISFIGTCLCRYLPTSTTTFLRKTKVMMTKTSILHNSFPCT